MDLSTFIIAIFCLVDDRLKDRRIRQRGPSSKLSDSGVLTIEIVGEFLGLDADRATISSSVATTANGSPPSKGSTVTQGDG